MINLDFISPGKSTLSPGESTLGPGEWTFSSGELTQKSGETSSGEWVIGRNDLIPMKQYQTMREPERVRAQERKRNTQKIDSEG